MKLLVIEDSTWPDMFDSTFAADTAVSVLPNV